MAATPPPRVSDNPAVQDHYAAQVGLAVSLAQASANLPTPGSPTAVLALALLIQHFQSAAVSLSADYYAELRADSVPGTFRPPVLEPWPEDQLTAYLTAALKGLPEAERTAQAVAIGQHLTNGASVDEIFASIDADPRDVRWARVTRPGACSLCTMAAVRGARYRTETSAEFRPHMRLNGVGGNCQCSVEPSFTSYEPPAHIRAAQVLYSEATDGVHGSEEKQNAFRRALYAEAQTSR